jgi:hypothetical protein
MQIFIGSLLPADLLQALFSRGAQRVDFVPRPPLMTLVSESSTFAGLNGTGFGLTRRLRSKKRLPVGVDFS